MFQALNHAQYFGLLTEHEDPYRGVEGRCFWERLENEEIIKPAAFDFILTRDPSSLKNAIALNGPIILHMKEGMLTAMKNYFKKCNYY